MYSKKSRMLIEAIKYKTQIACQHYRIHPDNLEVRDMPERLAEEIVLKASYKVYGRDLDQIRFPSNWIEAFKARWFPKWLKKKFPVQFNIIKIEALLPLRAVKEESIVIHVTREEI